MQSIYLNSIEEAFEALNQLKSMEGLKFLEDARKAIVQSFEQGGKLLIAGNGGSLCDAMHFAEELTGFFRERRDPLPAIALSDPGHMSCVANDESFDEVFARGVASLGKEGDIFIPLTTSGKSRNLVQAAKVAKERGIKVLGFLGRGGGEVAPHCDLKWIVNGNTSDRIQEVHMTAIHIIIEAVEETLLGVGREQELLSTSK